MRQKDLAKALNLSEAMVSRLVQRGMPTDSVEAARKWRRRHLEPARVKGVRMNWDGPPPVAPATSERDRLRVELVDRLCDLCEQDFDRWAPKLRAELRALPQHLRERAVPPLSLMDRLTAHVRALLRDEDEAAPAAPMTESEAEFMGRFWFAVAAGEFELRDGVLVALTVGAAELMRCIDSEAEQR